MLNKKHSAITALALLFVCPAGHSQGAGETGLTLEEIIVTARKREESVQEVPLSITPFLGDQLLRRDIQTVEDLASNTVGLSYNQGISAGTQGSATIRGLATNFAQDRFQNVGIYLNGVYLERQSMMNLGMVDLSRIEVVKGPQNSLYGRNAFAGAINYITSEPHGEFDAYVSTTQGSDNREDYRGAVNVPIVKDKLYGRISYGMSDYDGANPNLHPFSDADVPGFNSKGNLGGWDDETYTASFVFTPTDRLKISATYYEADIRREYQSGYFINGLQEIASLGTSQFDDMNFNRKTLQVRQGFVTNGFTANTLYQGALPETPGRGTYVPAVAVAPPPGVGGGGGPPPGVGGGGGPPPGVGGGGGPPPGVGGGDAGGPPPGVGGGDAGGPPPGVGGDMGGPPPGVGGDMGGPPPGVGGDMGGPPPGVGGDMGGPPPGVGGNAGGPPPGVGGPPPPPPTDQAIFGAIDPRGFGAKADSKVVSVDVDWGIADDWRLNYQFGYVEHQSRTNGPSNRDPMQGASYVDAFNTIYASTFSARPNTNMDSASHELRLEWSGHDRLTATGGVYYAETEDEAYELTVFSPVCGNRDVNNSGSADDEMANCNLRIAPGIPSPLDNAQFLGVLDFFNRYWNGNPTNHTLYDDEVLALFLETNFRVTDDLTLRLEARYTEEDRKVVRATDIFGLAPGQVGVGNGLFGPAQFESAIIVPEDSATFKYFTPRVSLDWAWREGSLLYAYGAKGVKSGGFNNATAVEDLTYDEEENWTFEIGSKNLLFDNRLTLNAALFYVDWSDIQGGLSPVIQSQNSNVVIGNIGDAGNFGLELEGALRFNNQWSVDFGYMWIDPEYDNAHYDAAQRYYYYNCPQDVIPAEDPANPGFPFLCGETNVDGNQLARTSKHMAVAGLNYTDKWLNWTVRARLDGNYQSKRYVSPLNVAYIDNRALMNGSLSFLSPDGHWDLTLWGKNLTDESYVQSVFNIALFNNMLVATGQGLSWGVTLKLQH